MAQTKGDFVSNLEVNVSNLEVKMSPGLYIVATPIGNLGDITRRAVDFLRTADVVACEDSRVTAKLLKHLGIDRPLAAYHEHNAAAMRPKLLAQLAKGARVVLISDAGTPLISDPGYKLVKDAQDAGIMVHPVPGAAAFVAALTVAGLPTDRFLFLGFPPSKKAARRRFAEDVANIQATLVLYESPRRLADSLNDLAAALGDRQAAVCRELTKLYEEVRRGPLSALEAWYREHPPKGEIVIVIAPPEKAVTREDEVDAALKRALKDLSVREAATAIAFVTGEKRRKLYARALELAGRGSDAG